ncbi:MAG: manganese efflux pump [Firmicutes bacterium]|nr:manganese efflux pump [Bacillota bacterium]HPZ91149.1 manganese efflux pump MntP family protein [Bacillota bacterium]HQE01994.1 manganese efflux pump MntP family protein [Bacillota bacterium]
MKNRLRLSRTGVIIVLLVLLMLLVNGLRIWGGALATLSSTLPRQLLPLLLLAAALGTDAMSLSVGIGLRGVTLREILRLSGVIGLFHVFMPLIGAWGGQYLGQLAGEPARWVGAAVVAFIGVRMIRDCLGNGDGDKCQYVLTGLPLLLLAASVSIDALSVGFSLGALGYNIFVAATLFGLVGAAMTAAGLLFGGRIGRSIGDRGGVLGGCVLVALAVHMLLEG